VFPSPIRQAANAAAVDAWRNQTHAPTLEKTYLRKAAYEYGWDWGPRLVTSGIWRGVRLETWDKARISSLYVQQRDIHPVVAHIAAQVEVTASAAGSAIVSVRYNEGTQSRSYSQRVLLHTGTNSIIFPIEIVKPDLWYPAGYGKQPLYKFSATLSSERGVEDTASTRAGLRTVVLRRDVDQWGRSFEFVVNGIPIFAKGASVIPFDSFPSRVTAANYKRVLEAARDANMNMVRQWGGGYYESDEFYNLCDELGLMVWQDFMFGNEWQPGSYVFKQNVESEVTYQIQRLRNHPSVVLWCGNNETEASWNWPRTAAMTNNDPEIARHMWQNYLTLFSGVIAQTVARLDPETPFWPSSPSADYEDTSGDFRMPDAKNLSESQEYMSGDMHNYAVHAPEEYEQYFPRFMSEYGWLSFPDRQTIRTYTEPNDRTSITTPVMRAHQDGEQGNADILNAVVKRYGQPKDLDSLVYLSQVMQAEWVRIGAEHLRRNMPRTMGSLFWQLNDCWPGATLSSMDYEGRWKALQYYTRRFYSPILLSPHIENSSLAVYVISDKMMPVQAIIRLRIMKPDGAVLDEKSQTVVVPPLSSKAYMSVPLAELQRISDSATSSTFAVTDLIVGEKDVYTRVTYFAPNRDLQLPKPVIHAEIVKKGGSLQVRLRSNTLARDVYVSFGDEDARLSDNYIDLLPNQERRIDLLGKTDIKRLQASLRVISLEDSIAPAEAQSQHK